MPLLSNLRHEAGERRFRRDALPGAERTSRSRPLADDGPPSVRRFSSAAPPRISTRARGDSAWCEPTILGGMPLTRDLGLFCGEAVGHRAPLAVAEGASDTGAHPVTRGRPPLVIGTAAAF